MLFSASEENFHQEVCIVQQLKMQQVTRIVPSPIHGIDFVAILFAPYVFLP